MEFQHQLSRRTILKAGLAVPFAASLTEKCGWAAESDLIVRSADPYNAEPPLLDLVAQRITPVKHFFVRIHGPLPKVEASTHKVCIEGMVNKPVELSLAEIKERLQQVTTEATLTCAGNRRQELSAIKQVSGVQWDAGAVGNATWTGPNLIDVLRMAELQPGAKHIWFEGLDPIKEKDGSEAPFGGSIPLDKAYTRIAVRAGGKSEDVPGAPLIAHSMNDQPLTPEHGHPLRMIVPGYIGARSVKWLTKITVSDRPSPNHYVAEAYKLVKTDDKAELAAADPIYSFGVNAAICTPTPEQRLNAGKTTIRGYVLPSGEPGCMIERVEISLNNGQSWTVGVIDSPKRPFTWSLWTAELNLPAGKHELVVRAIDSRGQRMPERGEWNPKGYMYNGWHRVRVEVA